MIGLRFIYLLLFCFMGFICTAQEATGETPKSAMAKHDKLVKTGRFKEAVSCLDAILNSKLQLSPKEKLVLNNNLGILHKNLGEYEAALRCYNVAESVAVKESIPNHAVLVSIYGNISNIYTIRGDLGKALDYCEKANRSISETDWNELQKQKFRSDLYFNSGIIYYQLNKFDLALSAFKLSFLIKEKNNLPGKDILYKQLANTTAKLGNNAMADKYFKLSISQSEGEKNTNVINLINIYLEYGHFLLSVKENEKALIFTNNALKISQETMGEHSHETSNCYQLLGDYYRKLKEYEQSLIYYQKSFISGSKYFKDSNYQSNPPFEEITINLWQLRVFQGKAEALEMLADAETDKIKKIDYLKLCFNTNNLVMDIINQIRVDYQNGETRMIFNEKQKNVFDRSVEAALQLYNLTSEKQYLYLAYQSCQQSKANELKYEIARNKGFSNNEIPDSLQTMEREIQNSLSAYGALIRTESSSAAPDTLKIEYWKDQQFTLNRALEKNIETIEHDFPRFTDKLKKGNIVGIETIQANLKPYGTLIEYNISARDSKGDRKLNAFVITPNELICHTELIDSTLSAEFSGLKGQFFDHSDENIGVEDFNRLNKRLYSAYSILIKPLEKYFGGKQLIIIPDEELSYLPFDAFLTSWSSKVKINYAGLDYLIRDYSISFGYSTNTLWNNQIKAVYRPKIIGYAPEYSNSENGQGYNPIKNNSKEIKSILKYFGGKYFQADQASISNFNANLRSGAVLHLAMHAELDTTMAGSSSLVFTPNNSNPANYRLYNYEIGQMNINSPLVVLSACNTGNGKLYTGEGVMSLSRSFILAGVPAVVETLWPVEDIAGSKIMGSFYKYLADGKPRNIAMRLAKLEYIETTSPSFVNPRYWATYTLMGDITPIKKIWWKDPWLISGLTLSILVLAALVIVFQLRLLRIFKALFL